MRKTNKVVIGISLSLLFVSPAAWAGDSSASDAALTKVIRDAQVLDADSALTAKLEGMEAVVTTDRHPKATDDDCKIDATLIAKAVFEKHKNLAKVRINFVGTATTTSVSISAGDICAFNNGGINEKQLLNGIDLTTISKTAATTSASISSDASTNQEITSDLPDIPRDVLKRALNLRHRIQTLRHGGTGVSEFQKRLDRINDLIAERKEPEAMPLIDSLDDILHEQQKLANQAKFKPVPVASSWQGRSHLEDKPQLNKGLPPISQYIKNFLTFSENNGVSVSSERARYEELVRDSERDPNTQMKMQELAKSLQTKYPTLFQKFAQTKGVSGRQGRTHENSNFGPNGNKPLRMRKKDQY